MTVPGLNTPFAHRITPQFIKTATTEQLRDAIAERELAIVERTQRMERAAILFEDLDLHGIYVLALIHATDESLRDHRDAEQIRRELESRRDITSWQSQERSTVVCH